MRRDAHRAAGHRTDPFRALDLPALRGASNWMSPSYNPQTGLMYVPTLEQCDIYTASETIPEPMKEMMGGGAQRHEATPAQFFLRAWDPLQRKTRWSTRCPARVTPGPVRYRRRAA